MCFNLEWPISCASTASSSGSASCCDQRVEQHDLAEAAEAGEESVRVPRPFAAVHDLDAPGAEAGSLRQRQEPVAQAAVGQRRELVEQRQDQHRREHKHQQLKTEQRAPTPRATTTRLSTRRTSAPAPAADSRARSPAAALSDGPSTKSLAVVVLKPNRCSKWKSVIPIQAATRQ